MNWKKRFTEIILERGYGYFLDSCVEDLKIRADGYKATVWGTESYRVEIALCNPDEWETEREEFFDSVKDNKRLKELYFEEKLYDRLMDCLMKSTTEWELSGYENALKPLYPNELLARYEADVRRRAEQAGGREHYKHLVDSLIHMRKYQNGKEQVNAIVNEWRCIYKRRPALMEELKKKGL